MKPTYESPLASRYASKTMLHLFSPDMRYETWRRLWVALARAEHNLGLPVTQAQVDELAAHVSPIDYDVVAAREKEVRHDVMAHIYAYGLDAPGAKGIIHLGATSCYVGDNTDIIRMREALILVRRKLVNAIAALRDFSQKYKSVPTLAYTHFQAAQPTTVGKRATLWAYDLVNDLEQLDCQLGRLELLGCKGTTGTGASFLELFDGDEAKVCELERLIAAKMGFSRCAPVSGQTYSRKTDFYVLQALSGIAQSASKFSSDIRLLSHLKEGDEPFFAFYATPWPHAPVYVGDEFKGKSGMGTYVDCVTEFDYYLGKLFDTLEELGVMDDTIIVFTSDNGPALQGSTGDLRGGKYLAYEGGQKVPFMIRWGNNGGLFKAGSTYDESATLVDLFPTLVEMCGITGNGGTEKNYLPADRVIDGVSMVPVFTQNKVIHTAETPILHMKREKLKAIQYAIPTADILSREEYKDYDFDVLKNNEYVVFKYFKNIQNDNSAFFDKFRKNWLHILTDDAGENYNRTPAYPTIADEMLEKLDEIMNDFKENRRGIIEKK